jgi:hypothetical protein
MTSRILFLLFAALLWAGPVMAQFEIKGGARNVLDQRRAGASANLVGPTVTYIWVRNGGSGYTSPPLVVISAPASGTTATATAVVSGGRVTAIHLTNGGSGYTSVPNVFIAPPAIASGAAVTTPQFAGMAGTSASSRRVNPTGARPQSSRVILVASSFGYSFASGVPRYLMGSVIERPTLSWNGSTVPASYWRPRPVNPGEVFTPQGTSNLGPLSNPVFPGGTVSVTKSTAGDIEVTVASLPDGLVSGATLLGSKVASVSGTTVKLITGANQTIPSATATPFLPPEPYYFSPHAGRVFASQPGRVTITWVSAAPDTSGPGETVPSYKFRQETFAVSSGSAAPVRQVFWTEKGFDAQPVTIPTGRISRVNVLYNPYLPSNVVNEFVPVGSNPGNVGSLQETRTLWFENQGGQAMLRAYNEEGRVLVEYLGEQLPNNTDGVHVFLGADVVDVQRVAEVVTVPTNIGDALLPRTGPVQSGDGDLIPQLVPRVAVGQKTPYGTYQKADGTNRYFAERQNDSPDNVTIYWLEEHDAGIYSLAPPDIRILWPKLRRNYIFEWPTSLALFEGVNVLDNGNEETSALQFNSASLPELIFQDDPAEAETRLDGTTQRLLVNFSNSTDRTNRTLLKFSSSSGPAYVRLYIQSQGLYGSPEVPDPDGAGPLTGRPAVSTLNDSNADGLPDLSFTVNVGQRLQPPSAEYALAGYLATGRLYSEEAYINPFVAGVEAAAAGGIIPVNTAAPGGDSTLTVWWLKKISHPDGLFQPFYTPAKAARYTVIYPANPERLVIASGRGFDPPLTTAQAEGKVYVQNDPAQIGYNPNEEHALMLAGNGYALRTDLNVTTGVGFTSQPFVLIAFTEPGAGSVPARPAMRIARVEASNATFPLRYDQPAGAPLARIMPLEAMPLPLKADDTVRNEEVISAVDNPPSGFSTTVPGLADYRSFTYVDRKGQHWLYRGAHTARNVISATYGAGSIQVDVTARVRNWFNSQTSIAITLANLGIIPDPVPNGNKTLTVRYQLGAQMKTVAFPSSLGLATAAPIFIPEARGAATPPSMVMRYYYKSLDGFFVPGRNPQPAVGTIMPFIAALGTEDKVTGNAINIEIVPRWPDDPVLGGRAKTVPELQRAETLLKPKSGLPQVRGQKSAQVIYQQSIAISGASTPSVRMHDSTREKTFAFGASGGLTALPAAVNTTPGPGGRLYFQGLPAHLQSRVYFNPNTGTRGSLVFIGEFIDEVVGEDYLNLNMLTENDRQALIALCPSTDANYVKWTAAINGLSTKLETFRETPAGSSIYKADATLDQNVNGATFTQVTDPDTAVDSYALSSTGDGTGYVTLLFGNGQAFTDGGDPVVMQIVRVNDVLYRGDLKVLLSSNPLDEQVTLRHSGDYGGKSDNFTFQWRYSFPVNGAPPALPTSETDPRWQAPNGTWANTITVGEPPAAISNPAVLMGDTYFTMRYQRVGDSTWSDWMPQQLVEGWIKRVLAKITPFNQRVTDLFNNAINTDVSMLTQAGRRWEGDIALNLDNVNEAGLIEIYETILNRGKKFTIGNGIDFSASNDALLLAAGYLNDLYTILGNEAYADAANPTIAVDDADNLVEVNTSRFSFEGQVASSLDEELALLRGRDDFATPGTAVSPIYNRLYWNYTRGINSGEVLYAVNYNIREKTNSSASNGIVDAADAALMFPQGHGDAYGHYLTSLKNYYKLLTHPFFTWTPRPEAITLLGQVIQVDYQDERKFAAGAANLARATQQVISLTHRQVYKDGAAGWSHLRDQAVKPGAPTEKRHWGLDEWVSRGTQGNYLHWVTANALLPDQSSKTGVEKIDRTTVPEIEELATAADTFQTTLDSANAGLNPLGLSPGAIAFDISPSAHQDGQSHYEQVYERALRAVLNARGSFDQAANMSRLLRNQELQVSDQATAVFEADEAWDGLLEEIYGRPYAGDIGPGKTYAQGYEGPDTNRWMFIDKPTDLVDVTQPVTVTLQVPTQVRDFSGQKLAELISSYDGSTVNSNAKDAFGDYINATQLKPATVTQSLTIRPNQTAQYATSDMGVRTLTGSLQDALRDAQTARAAFREGHAALLDLQRAFKRESQLVIDIFDNHAKRLSAQAATSASIIKKEKSIAYKEHVAASLGLAAETANGIANGIAESFPENTIVGLANGGDFSFLARSAILLAGQAIATGLLSGAVESERQAGLLGPEISQDGANLEQTLMELELQQEQIQTVYELEGTYRELLNQYFVFNSLAQDIQVADQQVRNLITMGDDIQKDRENYRKQAAAVVSGFRTRDLTFRTFRNEALEQYRTLFDLASRYTFLAAKSYDYETGLLGTTQGQSVINSIVASRALGDLTNDTPQATTSQYGDSGLAGTLARMNADFAVAEGRLGINNPDQNGTVFSLRHELFRIKTSEADANDDEAWQQTLEQSVVANLMSDPDVARYCNNLRKANGSAVPGLLIPFRSNIMHGENFFGLPLAGGDHNFSASNYATKILSAGMIFKGYVGMDPFIEGQPSGTVAGPNLNHPDVLAATPYVYLIPCGVDLLRAPPLGDTDVVRSWTVHDQALPLPYNLGATAFNSTQFFNAAGTLTEQPWILRKHRAFRVVADSNFFYSSIPQEFVSSRLIGRSAWNSQWKIVIPAYTLLSNEAEALKRFNRSVKDIQLFLRTYSHSGN